MNLEMEEIIIYKKDARYLANGKISPRQIATFLSGNKKDAKKIVSTFGNIKFDELIGKRFFAKIVEANGIGYIVEYLLKN